MRVPGAAVGGRTAPGSTRPHRVRQGPLPASRGRGGERSCPARTGVSPSRTRTRRAPELLRGLRGAGHRAPVACAPGWRRAPRAARGRSAGPPPCLHGRPPPRSADVPAPAGRRRWSFHDRGRRHGSDGPGPAGHCPHPRHGRCLTAVPARPVELATARLAAARRGAVRRPGGPVPAVWPGTAHSIMLFLCSLPYPGRTAAPGCGVLPAVRERA